MTKYIPYTLLLIVCALCVYLWLQPPKIVKEVRTVVKTATIDKVVYKDRIIERIIKPDGTIIEKEIIKDKIVEKEVVKEVEKEVIKYHTASLCLSVDYLHFNSYPDAIVIGLSKSLIGNLYVGISYSIQVDPNFLYPAPILHIENWGVGLKLLF